MTQPGTVFDALMTSVQKAADYNRDDMTTPVAVLWPDEKREWERLVPRLRAAWPHFLTFGPFDPANRSGPAIWLRCVLAGKLPDLAVPAGTVPVIYLPGVSRSTLRATEECPAELKPLAELQYRGVFWSQVNGKDWTVTAFLQSSGGLELTIARDAATATAIRRSIEHLAGVPVADLKAKSAGGELSSPYFDGLVVEDFVDDLLCWLSDPKGCRERWEASRWETLCSRCPADYGFDPARDGELAGAEKLGLQEKTAWKTAWKRFATGPDRYPGLATLLRQAKPKPKKRPGLFDDEKSEAWPQDNEADEAELRQALLALATSPVPDARKRLAELEANHGPRREWVWAKLGRSPLAHAVRHLATLADATKTALGGATAADMVRAYTEGGWRADAAVLDAVAAVSVPQDRDAVCAAVAHVYTPWLRDAAEAFQQRVTADPLPGSAVRRLGDVPAGTCVLFADGLRYDLGEKLRAALSGRVGHVGMGHHFAALPSVTPTAKPAVSPVAGKITGTAAGENFMPAVAHDGKELTTDRFRKLLDDAGYQVLALTEAGDPSGRAWTEYGNVDRTGHDEGINLARRIPELITNLALRIEALIAAGWREVRVVTDHGWLLLPGGLPKGDLPKYLTATRWRRCAVVKPTSAVEQPTFAWFWAEDVRVACPPGIEVFMSGVEYDHGGLSLQECVVPQLAIQAGAAPSVSAKIEGFKWAGLRCRVKLAGSYDGCQVDLRDKPADPTTSLAAAKPAGPDGSVAVVVTDDTREGSATTLVLLDPAGRVIEKTPVTVGG